MKRLTKNTSLQAIDPPLHNGFQWGEPPRGESHILVNRIGKELEITGAMPEYWSECHPCDLILEYEIARKDRSIGKQRTGKDSPHIRFANAESDEELINFVRSFGPVVSKSWKMLPFDSSLSHWSAGDPPRPILIRAQQDLQELRIEQRIYKAALGLVAKLAIEPPKFNIDSAKVWIAEIVRGIRDWPRQWNREKAQRDRKPLWKIHAASIRRIAALAKAKRDPLLPPQLDARIVLCELLNVFPALAFPNAVEMHSYIDFGIRPLLYSVLRREFLQPRDLGVCANTQCRDFFEVERAGQQYCDDLCSRRQRQREYWKLKGKGARCEKLEASMKHQTS